MSNILKLAIATVVFAIVGFIYNSTTGGGHPIGWLVMGGIFGLICHPFFARIRQRK